MPSLPYPRTLTDAEFVRLADMHLLTDALPVAWQESAVARLRAYTDRQRFHSPSRPVAARGPTDNGRN